MNVSTMQMFLVVMYLFTAKVSMTIADFRKARNRAMERVMEGRHSSMEKKVHRSCGNIVN